MKYALLITDNNLTLKVKLLYTLFFPFCLLGQVFFPLTCIDGTDKTNILQILTALV